MFVTPGRGNFCFNTELAQIFSTREKKKRAETAIDIQTILGKLCCLVCELKYLSANQAVITFEAYSRSYKETYFSNTGIYNTIIV